MNNSFYPTLDVHGETRDTVVYPVKSFIQDNLKLQKKKNCYYPWKRRRHFKKTSS